MTPSMSRSIAAVDPLPRSAPDKSAESPSTVTQTDGARPRIEGRLWLKLFIGFAVLFAVAVAAIYLFGPAIQKAGTYAVAQFGLVGLVVAVLIIDACPTPLSYVPLMLLALEGGLSVWDVFAFASAASVVAGFIGYGIGRVIGVPRRFDQWIQDRFPEHYPLLRRYGAVGVFVAGALPFPFAVGTWSAGAIKSSFRWVGLACLVRIPKTGMYLALLTGALELGGAA